MQFLLDWTHFHQTTVQSASPTATDPSKKVSTRVITFHHIGSSLWGFKLDQPNQISINLNGTTLKTQTKN